jgi:hypothetical protein
MKPCQSKYKPKHPKKGEYKEQNGRTHVQEDKKEPSKRANHKGNIRFLNPPSSRALSRDDDAVFPSFSCEALISYALPNFDHVLNKYCT